MSFNAGFDNIPSFLNAEDAKKIMNIKLASISYGVQLDFEHDPFLSMSRPNYSVRMKQLQMKLQRLKKTQFKFTFDENRYMYAKNDKERRRFDTILQFEHKMSSLINIECLYCHGLFVDHKNNKRKFICKLLSLIHI